jgi:hypothetical protein
MEFAPAENPELARVASPELAPAKTPELASAVSPEPVPAEVMGATLPEDLKTALAEDKAAVPAESILEAAAEDLFRVLEAAVLFSPVLASTEFWNRRRFPASTADCRLSKLRELWSFSSFLKRGNIHLSQKFR